MTTLHETFAVQSIPTRRAWRGRHLVILLVAGALAMSALAGLAYPRIAGIFAGREMLVLVAMLLAWPLLVLSVAKYDLAVFAAFSLFAIVRVEPAPADALILFLFVLGIAIGRLKFSTLSGSSLVHLAVWTYLLANLASLLVGSAENLRFLFITLYMVVIFYFVKMYIHSVKTMRIVILGYLVSALLSVGLVALHYTGIGPDGLFVVNSRAKALFKDANVFGPYLVPMVVLLVDEIWRPSLIPGHSRLKLIAVLGLAAGVFLSFSRAAWGNLALVLAIYVLLNHRSITRQMVVNGIKIALVGAICLLGIVVVMDLQEFLAWRATAVQMYDLDRFAAQREALRQGFSNLVGLGPGMMDIGFYSPHSLYARTFGEHGIVGFVALMTLIGALMLGAFRRARQVNERVYGLSATVIFASAAGLLFNSFVIDTLHWRHFWLIMALLWVVAAADRSQVSDRTDSVSPTPANRPLLPPRHFPRGGYA